MVFSNNLLFGAAAASSSAVSFDTTLIGNSVWLDGSADFLSKTPSAGTTTRWIVSFWVNRNTVKTGAAQTIFSAGTSTGNLTWIRFDDADMLDFAVYQGSVTARKTSNARYRDATTWYHVCVSFDSDSGVTAADRIKLFVNGVEVTSLSASTATPSGETTAFNANVVHEIGRYSFNGGEDSNVYLTQFTMLENKSFQNGDLSITDLLDSFTFGTNGSQFGPKADADIASLASSAGGRSFCLDFANSSDLGNDISSNNNDFSPTSMAAANQSTSTPSLTFSTYNILDANAAFTSTNDGANTYVVTNVGGAGMRASLPITSGKWYWEQRNGGSNECGPAISAGAGFVNLATNSIIGEGSGSHSVYLRYDNVIRQNASNGSAIGITNGTTAVIGVAFDADTGKVWFRDSSGFGTSGDPANGTNEHATLATTSAPFFIAARVGGAVAEPFLNAGGNPTFNGNETAGGNADANGHGNFKLGAVPSGFLALCSANIEPQEIQGVDGFATTLATESNIVSSVATSRDGWGTAYVDILKNRSSIETYLFRFGDDSSNEFSAPVGSYPNFTATYQSTSSLSGSDNFVGFSIRVGADYLTAAGSASHSNGAATTVTHNLGTSRYCVLLFERGSTKDTWLHHPDFASGSLLKIFKDEALTSSTQITTIGANSFQIGSGAATATYSYLVFADGGIAAMGKYIGNGAVSGPYISMAHSSGYFARRSGGTRSFWHNNSKSPGFNENGNYLRFNDPQAEGTGSLKIDMLAGAVKIRDDYSDQNTSGETFYWISFGELSGGGTSLPPVYGR
tara:strand:+ start:500 stop:2884 length:2385 start_codon:yes stop_codon:yes gene_type:complete